MWISLSNLGTCSFLGSKQQIPWKIPQAASYYKLQPKAKALRWNGGQSKERQIHICTEMTISRSTLCTPKGMVITVEFRPLLGWLTILPLSSLLDLNELGKGGNRGHMGDVTRKGPLCPESLSYQKKDGRVTRPSFFWYDTDFSKKKKKNPKIVKKNFFSKKF